MREWRKKYNNDYERVEKEIQQGLQDRGETKTMMKKEGQETKTLMTTRGMRDKDDDKYERERRDKDNNDYERDEREK